MNEYLDRIFELPRLYKIGILAVLILLLAGGFIYLDYLPRSAKITEVAELIDSSHTKLAQKQRLVAALPKLKKEYLEQGEKLKKALAQLPDKKEIPDLLSGISSRARGSGLDIMIFRPRPESPKDFYAEIPVDLVVRGGFIMSSPSLVRWESLTGWSTSKILRCVVRKARPGNCRSRLPRRP